LGDKSVESDSVSVIVERIQGGNDSLFDDLCKMYAKLVEHSVDSFAKSAAAIEGVDSEKAITVDDLRQEAHLALYRAAKTFDLKQDKVTFGFYAKMCIKNALISLLRKMKRRPKVSELTYDKASESDEVEKLLDSDEMRTLSSRLSEVLTDYENAVFMRYICGQKPRDIAAEMNTCAKSVSNAVFRARGKAKSLMGK